MYTVWVTKKFPFRVFIKSVFIRATETERWNTTRSVQRLIKRSVRVLCCHRVLPTKQFFFLTGPRVIVAIGVCKSGEACCYFLGYKMSLQKIINDKSCVSCKEDDHARVFCLAIVPLCLYCNKNFENTCRLALMPSLRRSLDMPEARFPHRLSSKIRYLV